MKSIFDLAHEHMVACYFGKHCGSKKHHPRKEVQCCMCHRIMTVRDYENQPYYCYKCDQDIEGIHQ